MKKAPGGIPKGPTPLRSQIATIPQKIKVTPMTPRSKRAYPSPGVGGIPVLFIDCSRLGQAIEVALDQRPVRIV